MWSGMPSALALPILQVIDDFFVDIGEPAFEMITKRSRRIAGLNVCKIFPEEVARFRWPMQEEVYPSPRFPIVLASEIGQVVLFLKPCQIWFPSPIGALAAHRLQMRIQIHPSIGCHLKILG